MGEGRGVKLDRGTIWKIARETQKSNSLLQLYATFRPKMRSMVSVSLRWVAPSRPPTYDLSSYDQWFFFRLAGGRCDVRRSAQVDRGEHPGFGRRRQPAAGARLRRGDRDHQVRDQQDGVRASERWATSRPKKKQEKCDQPIFFPSSFQELLGLLCKEISSEEVTA